MISQRLKDLNITIPDAPDPVGAYVAYKQIDSLVFISGQLPIKEKHMLILTGLLLRLRLTTVPKQIILIQELSRIALQRQCGITWIGIIQKHIL